MLYIPQEASDVLLESYSFDPSELVMLAKPLQAQLKHAIPPSLADKRSVEKDNKHESGLSPAHAAAHRTLICVSFLVDYIPL